MKRIQITYLLLLLSFSHIFSQPHKLEGMVVDSASSEPLAFVNIVYNRNNQGTTSGIDGHFLIIANQPVEFLKFSYIGYKPLTIKPEEINEGSPLLIRLSKTPLNIAEVTVLPGENPAHRIIKLVTENRDKNNPEKMQSFSYTSYNKMYFTLDMKNMTTSHDTLQLPDSAVHKIRLKMQNDTLQKDSAKLDVFSLSEFFNKQHIFLMETVSERKFIFPDKNNEHVIATRVSGLKQPSFMILATQFQSFSFYNNLLSIGDKNYLNPVAEGSTKKYFFQIEDTMFNESGDTIFVIFYRPYKGKNFDGLKGVLHINSSGYAIQNVLAEPYEQLKSLEIRIQQKYEQFGGEQWFPVQLNTDIVFPEMILCENSSYEILSDTVVVKMIDCASLSGVGKSYLEDITLNPDIDPGEFSVIELKVDDQAHKKDDDFWESYRYEPLSEKDLKTYEVIDSLGKAEKLDAKLRVIEALASGYIPYGPVNIDFTKIINFNMYEGYRLGLGISTNEKVSRRFSVGGYGAYGFRDKTFKYGGHIEFTLHHDYDIRLRLAGSSDVCETGKYEFLDDRDMLSSEAYRPLMVEKMHNTNTYRADFTFRTVKYLKTDVYFLRSTLTMPFLYEFDEQQSSLYSYDDQGNIAIEYAETGIRFRYAFREKFMKTPKGYKFSLGTKYPVFYLNFARGSNIDQASCEYLKAELKICKVFTSKSLGKTSVQIACGATDRSLPAPLIYNGKGSYRRFPVETANSFATVRMNEFMHDRFAFLFLRHDFGSLLFKTKIFQPKLILCHHIGYGSLQHPEDHLYVSVNTMGKGFLESGILINNLISQSIFGYGVGVFYRYGPYSLQNPVDNFAVKLTLYTNL
ncbi:MAG: DUF5686 family protein [Bacteroidota bacterium]